jgi:hypothetical protein
MDALKIFIIIALFAGFIDGLLKVNNVRNNPRLGVRPSRGMFDFLFFD